MTFQGSCPGILKELEIYKLRVKVIKVLWEFPPLGWVKYNIDGASMGNPGPSSHAFCVRNEEGDLLHAKAAKPLIL